MMLEIDLPWVFGWHWVEMLHSGSAALGGSCPPSGNENQNPFPVKEKREKEVVNLRVPWYTSVWMITFDAPRSVLPF